MSGTARKNEETPDRALLDFADFRVEGTMPGLSWNMVGRPILSMYERTNETIRALAGSEDGILEGPSMFESNRLLTRRDVQEFVDRLRTTDGLESALAEQRARVITALRFVETELRKLGRRDEALEVYVQRRVFERDIRPWWNSLGDHVLGWTSKFGTSLVHVAGTAGTVIAVFAAAYGFLGVTIMRTVYATDFASRRRRILDAIEFSFRRFVSFETPPWKQTSQEKLIYYPGRRREASSGSERLIRLLATVETGLGWLLLIVFASVLTRRWID